MTMFDSTLSPRLAHLLIQEDSTTGRLIMPDGSVARDPLANSPPLTPESTFAFEPSPITKSKTFPPLESSFFTTLKLPPPTGYSGKPSLISLLSPPATTSRATFGRSTFSPPSPPLTAHPRYVRPSWPSDRPRPLVTRPLPTAPAGSSFPHRPDVFRRHSHNNYHAEKQVSPPKRYLPMEESMGSRAPISRTTKACNACRTRKVRCDAGGLPNGQPGTCSRCKESGVDCVYSVIQKKRGPCPGTVRGKPRRRSSGQRSESQDIPGFDEYPPYHAQSSSFPPPQEWTSLPPRPLSGNPLRRKSRPYELPSPSTTSSDSRRPSGGSESAGTILGNRVIDEEVMEL